MLLSLCLVLLMQCAFAEKTNYKDSKFDFKTVKTVAFYDMDFSQVKIPSKVKEKSMNDKYLKKIASSKIPDINMESVMNKMSLAVGQDMDELAQKAPDEFTKVFNENIGNYVELYVTADLLKFEAKQVYHPETVTWETRTETIDQSSHGSTTDNWNNTIQSDGGWGSTGGYVTEESWGAGYERNNIPLKIADTKY